MAAQPTGGLLCLLEGAGSDGSPTEKYAAYGATKAALRQLVASLQLELKGTPVRVLAISPGMVWTDLVSSGRNAFGSLGRAMINVMADSAEAAAAAVVPSVLRAAEAEEGAWGVRTRIEVLTPLVALKKLARRIALGENRGRWYREGGNEAVTVDEFDQETTTGR